MKFTGIINEFPYVKYILDTQKKNFLIVNPLTNEKDYEFSLTEFNITKDFRSIINDLERIKTMIPKSLGLLIENCLNTVKEKLL